IEAIASYFNNMTKVFTREGHVYTVKGNDWSIKDQPFGFNPVAIFRGKQLDPCTPYGDDLVWPATNETRQCTYLNNDIMVLEKMQSYSTLVIKGEERITEDQAASFGPFAHIRLTGGVDNDAYYI